MTEKTNRIIVVKSPGILEMARTARELDDDYKEGKLDLIALNPHKKFRLYLRAVLPNPPKRIEIDKAGHYSMLLNYLRYRKIKGVYLDRHDFKEHLERIQLLMQEHGYRNLASVVNPESQDFFAEEFSKHGFTVI